MWPGHTHAAGVLLALLGALLAPAPAPAQGAQFGRCNDGRYGSSQYRYHGGSKLAPIQLLGKVSAAMPTVAALLMRGFAANAASTTAPATTLLSCEDMNRQFGTCRKHWGRMPIGDSPLRARWMHLKCKVSCSSTGALNSTGSGTGQPEVTKEPIAHSSHTEREYCVDFKTTAMAFKDTTWRTPGQLCVWPVQNASILRSGRVFNGTSAYTFDKWYWETHAPETNHLRANVRAGKKFISFVQIWQDVFQHMTFDTYPKSKLLCPFMTQHPELDILVMNDLQRDLIRESCTLPGGRFKNLIGTVSAASIAVTVWPGDFKMGIVPPDSFTSLGPQHKRGDTAIYIPRRKGAARSVTNEKDVLNVLRNHFGYKLLVYNPKNNWREDRTIFESASIIIGPHGGAMANMIFAPVKTTIIEFLPLTRLKSQGENERPCYFGLARGMGFDYHAVEPSDFRFEGPMTVSVNELEKALGSITSGAD